MRAAALGFVLFFAAVVGAVAGPTAAMWADGPSPGAGHQTRAASARERQVTSARHNRRHRAGCHKYCRQLGGFGGGGGGGAEGPEPVRIKAQTLRVDRFGQIAVRARCARAKRCVGAILVYRAQPYFIYGRADVVIRGRRTRRVWVNVYREGRRALKRRGREKRAFATVVLNERAPVSGGKLTLLPHR